MEYYNQNMHRKFPFTEASATSGTLLETSAPYMLANDVFVEARLSLTRSLPQGPVTLAALRFSGVDAILSLDFAGYPVELSVGVAIPENGKYWAVRGFDTDSGISFLFVFGHGLAEAQQAIGPYTLEFTTPPALVPTLIRYLDKVRVMSISDGTTKLTGKVVFEPGYNCGVEVTRDRIRLTAAVGEGDGQACADLSGNPTCDDVLFRVNGAHADAQSGLTLVGGAGITITARPSEHAIDIFATPSDEC